MNDDQDEMRLCYECGQSMLYWQYDYHRCPIIDADDADATRPTVLSPKVFTQNLSRKS